MLTPVWMKAALSLSSMTSLGGGVGAVLTDTGKKKAPCGRLGCCCPSRQIFGLDGVLICFSSLALSPQARAETLDSAKTAASIAETSFFIGISFALRLPYEGEFAGWFQSCGIPTRSFSIMTQDRRK